MIRMLLVLIITSLLCQCSGNPRKEEVRGTVAERKKEYVEEPLDVQAPEKCKFIESIYSLVDSSLNSVVASDDVTRNATLRCFINLYRDEFNELIGEELTIFFQEEITGNVEFLIKKLEFNNPSIAAVIFEAYSKGFHENCIGVKEPHFILLHERNVLVFYVKSERNRAALKKLQPIILNRLSDCEEYKLHPVK